MILYSCITDFVLYLKKIEVAIALKYNLEKITVFKGVVIQKIPRRGQVEFSNQLIDFYFHGTGVSYSFNDWKVSYNFFRDAAFGISFNKYDLNEFAKNNGFSHHFTDDDFNKLCKFGMIKKLWQDAETFYLKNNFDD